MTINVAERNNVITIRPGHRPFTYHKTDDQIKDARKQVQQHSAPFADPKRTDNGHNSGHHERDT